jgi:hypothetical protein
MSENKNVNAEQAIVPPTAPDKAAARPMSAAAAEDHPQRSSKRAPGKRKAARALPVAQARVESTSETSDPTSPAATHLPRPASPVPSPADVGNGPLPEQTSHSTSTAAPGEDARVADPHTGVLP